MKKYSAVVFDLGNVLIPFNYTLMTERFNSIKPGLGDKFAAYYKNNYDIHRQFERGDISEQDFIQKMLEVLEYKIDGDTFCKYYSQIFTVNHDVASLLPKLKGKYKLVLLSNTNSIHREYGWKDNEFLKYFDKLILSYEARAVKPEEKIYRTVEEFTNLPSEEHIFIDDVAEYVEGAQKAGWDAVQFLGYERLMSDLKEKNII
ncbi:MAG: HAD family hydrolase [Ignavibacteriaceae bacterium]